MAKPITAGPEHDDELQRLRAVNSVSIAVSQTLELETVLESALTAAMSIFDVDSGGIYLADENEDTLVLKVFKNLAEPYLHEKTIVGYFDGCTGTAARNQEIFAAFDHPESKFICEDSKRLLGVDCLMAAPLVSRGKVVGVLELFAPTSRRLTREEAELTTLICSQIAVAVDNAQLYSESVSTVEELEETRSQLVLTNARLQAHLEEEAFIARTLQQSLLPPEPRPIKGIDIGTFHTSATKHALVGGDFYDILELPKKQVAFVIGDASGHGIVVSPRSAAVKYSIRSYLGVGRSPSRALELANQTFLHQRILDSFVTAFVVSLSLDTGDLKYAIAGHPPPLLYRSGIAGAQVLECGSPALGITENAKYRLYSTKMEPGDVLLLYTDGLTEARLPKDDELFGINRSFSELEAHAGRPAKEIATLIARSAYEFSGGNLSDDMAILAIKFEG